MTLKTLDLNETAALLHMTPEGLRRKVFKGEIPAAKPGKIWCFIEDDIVKYLRSLYTKEACVMQGVNKRGKKWHSTNATISGGLTSVMAEDEYRKVLGLPTK